MEFREILRAAERDGSLVRVSEPVSPRFGVASVLHRFDGRPVRLDGVDDGAIPIVGNLLSTPELFGRSLGASKETWIPRLIEALSADGPVEETSGSFVYREPDLDLLPILTHFPGDQGPYVTSGVVFARRGEERNMSFHRLSRLARDRFVGRLVEHRDLHRMYLEAREHGEDVDVAVAIGNSAGVLVAGATSVEPGRYELGIAAALEKGVRTVRARTNSVSYPADSEIVIEGKILHDETAKEGPFVDLTNTYDGVRVQPVLAVDRIALRPGAVYHALLPGGNEHRILMGAPRTPTIYRALRAAKIDVTNVYLTPGGSGWLEAVIAIRKRDDAEPRRAIAAAIEGHRSLKRITIVDSDVDPTDPVAVDYAVTMYWEAGKEVIQAGVRGSSLDPMATPEGLGSKLALDATRPLTVAPDRALKMRKAELAPGKA